MKRIGINARQKSLRKYATLHDNKPFPITLDQAVNVMRVIHEARRGTEFEIRT